MQYISDHKGSTTGAKTGKFISYEKDEPFEAAEGDVDHVGGIEPCKEDLDKPTSANTKAEIKDWLDDQGIEYSSDALKDELLELVE